MPELYVGLISGTSTDGIDAALVDFDSEAPGLVHALNHPFSPQLRTRIEALIAPGWHGAVAEIGAMHAALGSAFAEATIRLLEQTGVPAASVQAIGSHGQTVCHAPEGVERFSLQLGDPNRIAATTGITTVADFRGKDLALQGQGAPLVPAFHAAVLRTTAENRAILNLGGIANLTLLPADSSQPVNGFDTGPANTLLDGWIRRHRQQAYDHDGAWAQSGHVNGGLLDALLDDPYFAAPAPKSTGRELFNQDWLDRHLAARGASLAPEDVQATLLELTAQSVARAIDSCALSPSRIIACGGGTHNGALMTRLSELLVPRPLEVSDEFGISADWMEAMAFAWLARQRLQRLPGNLPTVTGASRPAILGAIYTPD